MIDLYMLPITDKISRQVTLIVLLGAGTKYCMDLIVNPLNQMPGVHAHFMQTLTPSKFINSVNIIVENSFHNKIT